MKSILISLIAIFFSLNIAYSKIENNIVVKIENEIITNFEIKNKILSSLIISNQEINQKNINEIKKSSLEDWPFLRKIITKIRYYLVKVILNTRLDSSGGFRCYNISKIKKKDVLLAENNGYFFLIESLFYLERLNYKIFEILSNLKYRSSVLSKMRLIDILSALINLFKQQIKKYEI